MDSISYLIKNIDTLQKEIDREEKILGQKHGKPRKPVNLKNSKSKQKYHTLIKSIESNIADDLPSNYSCRSFITKQNGYIYATPMIGIFFGEKSSLSSTEAYILLSFSKNGIKIQITFGFQKIARKLGITDDTFKKFINISMPYFIKMNNIKDKNGFNFCKNGISLLTKELNIKELKNLKSDIYYLIIVLGKVDTSIYQIINDRFDLGINDVYSERNEDLGWDTYLSRKVRIGHSKYAELIRKKWKGICCITGCELEPILIASHIKPWAKCTSKEKVDPENGLLLSPNYDALFDRNLISFDTKGRIIISKKISINCISKIGISTTAKIKLNENQLKYMEYHRGKFQEIENSHKEFFIDISSF